MSEPRVNPPLSQRLLLTGVAAASMGVLLLAAYRTLWPRESEEPSPAAAVVSPGAPIDAEAQVFRTAPGVEAVNPDARRRATAHPRTLATERLLRSYPGAPPRVPHGLTAVEFRTGRCTTCHERGGFSPRFEAYAPVTPHPEWAACLTCHATNSAQFGLVVPRTGANAVCRQCHAGTPVRFAETGVDWRTTNWPTLSPRTPGRAPPVIPHALDTRGNCLACHMGPGAVAELRTSHPERSDCRGCHVLATTAESTFVRAPVTPAVSPRRSR